MRTTIEGFQHLESDEFDALLNAPALITILVGAADGDLDQEERHWSERLMHTRAYNKPKELNAFYRVVSEIFWVKLNGLLAELPHDSAARCEVVAGQLAELNAILAKLDPQLGADLYKGFRGLAEETAKASGGFLRIGAISPEEAKWIKLPMLTPVVAPKGPVQREEETEEF